MTIPNTIASDTLVEAVARAIYTQSYRNFCGGELPDANDESWRSYKSEAQAALTAITEAGYAVVSKDVPDALGDAVYVVRNMLGESEWYKRNGWRDTLDPSSDFAIWAYHWQEMHPSVVEIAEEQDRAMISAAQAGETAA